MRTVLDCKKITFKKIEGYSDIYQIAEALTNVKSLFVRSLGGNYDVHAKDLQCLTEVIKKSKRHWVHRSSPGGNAYLIIETSDGVRCKISLIDIADGKFA